MVFYGENVQRMPLPLVRNKCMHPFFLWLQFVRLINHGMFQVIVKINWLNDRAIAPFSAR